ncbi:MAG TPA: class I SAM-dependent methyltransferase [Solirubrobacterales bacterium]|nr:class I SAM-dependent methyltransferase [Solirubrobacterales bacterium]
MGEDMALAAYEAFAPIYNDFNHLNDYEMWLGRVLLPELEKHGLKRGRALDVGCGSGRAFAPLLKRGWQIRGCDLSPSMIELAREEAGGEVEVSVADMRELPVYGEFELVICLNDAINYLLGDDDLQRTLEGMAANLSDDGLLLFDVNARTAYEGDGIWASGRREVEHGGRRWVWRGIGEIEPGVFESRIEGDVIETVVNRERHRPEAEVRETMEAAGLDCLAALGMDEANGEIILSDPIDEQRDYKMVFIGRKAG